MVSKILKLISLQTAPSRLFFFTTITAVIYNVSYSFLDSAKLSLYERLHINAPSIGLTRAYWKLLHGDAMGAWHRNKLIYIVVAILIGIVIRDIISLMKRSSVKL